MLKSTYTEERNWGKFEKFSENEKTTVKLLYINKGGALHLQTHKNREEFWKIVSGNPILEIDGVTHNAVPGEEYVVGIGKKHRISCPINNSVVLEIARGNFDENDIVHY
jgi:mannose-6-phosphate isomerase-like protein (cupin superfamily)